MQPDHLTGEALSILFQSAQECSFLPLYIFQSVTHPCLSEMWFSITQTQSGLISNTKPLLKFTAVVYYKSTVKAPFQNSLPFPSLQTTGMQQQNPP